MEDDTLQIEIKKLTDQFPKFKSISQIAIYYDWGWYPILTEFLEKIYPILEKENGFDEFYITQIKEKWGSLRIYVSAATDEIFDIIDETEDLSEHLCEICGTKDDLVITSGWVKTYCKDCAIGQSSNFEKPNHTAETLIRIEQLFKKWSI